MNTWVEAVKRELGLDLSIDVDALLDAARIAAHTIERPAAPVTTYLIGIAVANGADLDATCKKISELASTWPKKE